MNLQLSSLERQPDILCLSGFGRPFGVNCDASGRIYITDMDLHQVFCLSSDLQTISCVIRSDTRLNGPHSIAFDQQQNAYVTTYYSPAIIVFDQNANYVRVIGDQSAQFPLKGPASAFLNSKDELMISEYALNAVFLYSLQGEFLGEVGFEELDRPHMTKEGLDGHLYCADTWNHRIQRLSLHDGSATWLGSDVKGWARNKAQLSQQAGGFHAPVAISIKNNGDLLITDWGNNRLQIFSNEGELKYLIDNLGLNKPYDAQYLGQWIVVADSHHGRVLFVPQSQYQ